MKPKTKLGIMAAASVLLLAAVVAVWTERPRGKREPVSPRSGTSAFSDAPFTADMTILTAAPRYHDSQSSARTSSPAPHTYRGKIYAGTHAMRTDVEMGSGATASVIVRYDKNLAWILTPSEHYMEVPIQAQTDLLSALRDKNAQIEKQDLGAEQVGAYPCEKYHVRVDANGRVLSGWIWVARAPELHGFIVKAQDEASKEAVVLSHIQLGAPPASTFELPPGYHKLTTPTQK